MWKVIFVLLLIALAFESSEAKCGVCHPNSGVACMGKNQFQVCSEGVPIASKNYTCPNADDVCIHSGLICVDPSTSSFPQACGDDSKCDVCNGEREFACTSPNTFTKCDGNQLSEERGVCPYGLWCDPDYDIVTDRFPCVDRCRLEDATYRICNRDGPTDVPIFQPTPVPTTAPIPEPVTWGYCGVCNKNNGVACISKDTFQLCENDQPIRSKNYTCPNGEICTRLGVVCIDPLTSSINSACSDESKCGLCNGQQDFTCTSRNTFTKCAGKQLSPERGVCPPGLWCNPNYVEPNSPCEDRCQLEYKEICNRDVAIDAPIQN